jgi:copper-binding protein NosD
MQRYLPAIALSSIIGLAGLPGTAPAASDTDAMLMLARQIESVRRAASAAPVDDFTFCTPIPDKGFSGVTNPRYYFLSEVGGCAQLACFLKQVASSGGAHAYATLVVDQICSVKETLTLPDRFTLSGTGIDGAGKLVFDLPDNASAIRFKSAQGASIRHATIRDLDLQNTRCCGQVGINVSNSSFVFVDRVRVQGFGFGIYGDSAYSIFVDHSNVNSNGFNAVLGDDTTAWRLRDNVFSQSGLIGVTLSPTARGNVVSGGRLESNPVTAIWVAGDMNVIQNNWFEGNGGVSNVAVNVTGLAEHTRVLGNLLSSDTILDEGSDTQLCFNMTFEPDPDNLNSCTVPLGK